MSTGTGKDPRLELAMAYREAGLVEKADALLAEMVREQTGSAASSVIKDRLAETQAKLDATLDSIADKLGVERIPRRRGPKRRR